jgi:ATP-dependent Clp protease ATP-binding subunit ClpC
MATHPYPVLLWNDASGACTAALVGDLETAAASAATEQEALRQLKELLDWRAEHEPWNIHPDLAEPTLTEVKVEIRPQYRLHRRVIPCPETMWLRVPCVTGKQESGLRLCVVPHLQVQFNFQEADDLKSLVAHYVKEALHQFSPAQLAARLPPRDTRLHHVPVRVSSERVRPIPPTERAEMKILFTVADPLLHDLGRKRTASAAYGREALAETLATKLGTEKVNVLLVGDSGSGKSTLLLDAVKRLTRAGRTGPGPGSSGAGESPEDEQSDPALRNYRFWRGSAGRLIAGMRYLGEWEERCEEFIAQLQTIEGVFCAESLLELAQVGGEGPGASVAAFLLPYLQRGELRMAAEATAEEVEACRRLLPGLLDVFQLVQVPPFGEAAAVQVLERIARAHATAARLELEPGAVTLAYRLFRRFQPYAAFPGPAAQFIRTLCEPRSNASRSAKRSVTAQDVVGLFVKQTGLPEIFLRDDLLLPANEVRAWLGAQVIGQAEATVTAARLLATIKTGLTDPGRPLGVLLFCGPTGVGKTALAKSLVEYCFGAAGAKDPTGNWARQRLARPGSRIVAVQMGVGLDSVDPKNPSTGSGQDRLVRLDMSEYSGWGAAQRLLQNPQGRPAAWIDRVRRQPFCVVLFDEIEKAAPEVFDVLLGLLDEGRLTDQFGRITWFRSAVIIMTSNLGADASGSAGFSSVPNPSYAAEVHKFFRPEFFNRLDGVITFQPLGPAEVEAIARKELAELAQREGLVAAGLEVVWSERLLKTIVAEGYDHRFGARPLQRAIENRVAVPLARWRVDHPKARALTILVDLDETGSVTVTVRDQG